jgi:hypothetical protein
MARTELPDVESLDLITPGQRKVAEILEERQSAVEAVKKLKQVVAERDLEIGAILDLNGLRNVAWGSYTVTRREAAAPRKTLSPRKLMELGVPASIIEQSYEFGKPGKLGIVVRRAGREETDDE